MKSSPSRKAFCVANYTLFTLLTLICLYPMWYVLVQSLSGDITFGKGLLVPNHFTLNNYVKVFQLRGIANAFGISVARTVIGCALTVTCCMLLGYLFSKPEMPYRKLLYRMLVITMYVSGGMIPVFLTYRTLGLMNTFWVYVLPASVSAYNVILIKTYVEQLPASIEESAMLDGAGTLTIFWKIILPMSMPIMATIAVYASVGQWNAWFDNHLYTSTKASLTTLQYVLYNYLNQAEQLAELLEEGRNVDTAIMLTPKGVRMTVTMITVLPVLFVYPFFQRFIIKGIMIGAVKG